MKSLLCPVCGAALHLCEVNVPRASANILTNRGQFRLRIEKNKRSAAKMLLVCEKGCEVWLQFVEREGTLTLANPHVLNGNEHLRKEQLVSEEERRSRPEGD